MIKRNSLRTKILLGTVLAVSILAAALIVTMISAMDYYSKTILSEIMRPMAKTAALAVQGDLRMLSDRISLIRDSGVFTDPTVGSEEKQRVLDRAASGTEFAWLGLFSTEGKLETGTPKSPPALDADFLFDMGKTGNLALMDTHAGLDNELEIVIGTPVISGSQIINYFVGSYNCDILNDALGNLDVSPVRGTRWTLAIDVLRKDFAHIIQRGIYTGLSIILVVLTLFAIISGFFITHFLTNPLKLITENTRSINQGIFQSRLPFALVRRNDEIGQQARAFVSMSQSIEKVICEIEKITKAARAGDLKHRADLTSMEGDYLKIVSGVNGALDVICSHLDAIPLALALFDEKKEMLYRNYAMDEFLLMHDLGDHDLGLLETIAGSGNFSSDQRLDPMVAAVFDPALSDPQPFVTDIAMLGHDGGSNFALTIQRAGRNTREKDSVCAILLLSDVTMLTRAKIDAEMASRTKSDFLSRMSHEIRTPMNAVIGMTQIAKGSSDTEKIHACLAQVENSSNHLLGVINDILDFSKIESGKLALDITEFSLAEDLDFVVSMMLPKARERNVVIKLSVENIVNDSVSADSLRLNQVLINLLSNAVKFSPDGSEILLNVRELGSKDGFSSYGFEVVDRGIGISEYQAAKLFRPFEQADGSITRNYGGTGLGLAISKNLVEMMGGKISLTSKEGEGSSFSFTIFCASKSSAEKRPDDGTASSGHVVYDFTGKRCLVVDDIEINRIIIEELLSETKLAMEMAANGQEAVDKFKSASSGYFDIILMDMQMPVLDGCSATREIRKIEKERAADKDQIGGIPIVAMTANVMQEDIRKALEAGMNAHLGKPIVLEETLKTMREQFSRASL